MGKEEQTYLNFWTKGWVELDQWDTLAFLVDHWTWAASKNDRPTLKELAEKALGETPTTSQSKPGNRLGNFIRRHHHDTLDPEACHKVATHILDNAPTTDPEKLAVWQKQKQLSEQWCNLEKVYQDIKNRKFSKGKLEQYRSGSVPAAAARLAHNFFSATEADFRKDYERFLPADQSIETAPIVSFACFRLATNSDHSLVRTRLLLAGPNDQLPYTQFWSHASATTGDERDASGISFPIQQGTQLFGPMKLGQGMFGAKVILLGPVSDHGTCPGLIMTRALNNPNAIVSRAFLVREKYKISKVRRKDLSPEMKRTVLGAHGVDECDKWLEGLVELPNIAANEKDKAEYILQKIRNFDQTRMEKLLESSKLDQLQKKEILSALEKSIKLLG
ncbi:hypothetical protein [Salaquimonas pukyongi]|uniref:hypothetical protein n=1 Tax=Salaquimonas pukyongi TaxID=2712698 RepID=UPI0012EBBA05|nr:hypothetical protein [Salaquimonas pukyongi]